MTFTPRPHQTAFSNLWAAKQRVLNFSGCGTGKTLSCIHAVQTHWPGARVLVVAPLSILETAWIGDLKFGWPNATYAIAAHSKSRKLKALNGDAQWVVTNHDAVKMIADEQLFGSFDVLIVDEADAFRNSSDRTKALQKIARHIPVMTMMTGTPTPKSVLDVWNIVFAVDFGERLGKQFTHFRKDMCNAFPIYGAPPGAMRYEDKPEANTKLMIALADIMTRTQLNDVTDLPDTIYRDIPVSMPKRLRTIYKTLEQESVIDLSDGSLNAVNAAARVNKLLQTVSGAVYDESGEVLDIHPDRHALAMDLALETDHALIAFNWKHQRDGLIRQAKKHKIEYAVIDGNVSAAERTKIVNDFQAGKYRVLIAHPQSAGHGLTLTKANRVIWASPNYRADLYEQFNHRIVRSGQTRKTEILHIAATDSVEEVVYEKLHGKHGRMHDLLAAVAELANAA